MLVTCRMIGPLVVVRFTWLIAPPAAEGTWPEALVVVRFSWLSVPAVRERIGRAEGTVTPAVWLTG